jgi:hypothetical protein
MTTIRLQSLKVAIPFRAGELPKIDPNRPMFVLELGTYRIACAVNAKAARKLAVHQGGAVLQGRLVSEGAALKMLDAGFQFFDPKPAEVVSP